MAIPVKLPVFEGPLDLLMHLIEKNKIDIYDIPIVEITDQYMEYVHQMDSDNMDVTSEFLVMAATLLDIKSKMLLPREKDEETGEEEDDPREELVRRLLEYKMYKYLSEELAVCREQAGVRFFREQHLPKEVLTYQPPVNYEELLKGTDLQNLQKVFGEVLRRKKSRQDPIRSGFGRIRREEISIDTKTLYIRAFLQTHPRTDFRALLESRESREEVIVTFLILLELIKTQKVHILQDTIGGKILVEASSDLPASSEESGFAPEIEESAGLASPDVTVSAAGVDESAEAASPDVTVSAAGVDESAEAASPDLTVSAADIEESSEAASPDLTVSAADIEESSEAPLSEETDSGQGIEDSAEDYIDPDSAPYESPAPPVQALAPDMTGRPAEDREYVSDQTGRPIESQEYSGQEYLKEETPVSGSSPSNMPLTAFRRMEIVSSPGPEYCRNLLTPLPMPVSSDGPDPASVFRDYPSYPEAPEAEKSQDFSLENALVSLAEKASASGMAENTPPSLAEKGSASGMADSSIPFFLGEKASHGEEIVSRSKEEVTPGEETVSPYSADTATVYSVQDTTGQQSETEAEKPEKAPVLGHLWQGTASCNTIAPVTLPGSPHFNQRQPDPLWRRRRMSRLWSRRYTLKQQ